MFASNDSGFHSRDMTSLSCQLYGLIMLLTGGMMAYWSIGKEGLHQTMKDITYSSTKENLLDEMHEIEGKPPINQTDINFIWVLNTIHLCIAFFFAAGELLGFDDSLVVVLGFVYALFWVIMGWPLFSPLYKGEQGE